MFHLGNIGHYTVELTKYVQRWVKGKGKINVGQPNVIGAYNEGIGGVDTMDRLLESYRPSVNKWWWSLFVNILNVSVLASWRLYQKANPSSSLSHLEFRRYITQVSVKASNEIKRLPVVAANISMKIRLNGVGHIIETTSQGRCYICKKNTKRICIKCNKRLHSERQKDCFYIYHNNKAL